MQLVVLKICTRIVDHLSVVLVKSSSNSGPFLLNQSSIPLESLSLSFLQSGLHLLGTSGIGRQNAIFLHFLL